MLLPLHVVAVASLWAYSSGNSLITQLAASITKRKGNTAFFECQVETSVLKKNRFIHWYQQKPGRPLERILYISSNENIFYEKGISEERFEARKRQDGSAASLRVHRVAEADAGTYYCACWDARRPGAPPRLRKNPSAPSAAGPAEHADVPPSFLPPQQTR